METLDNQDLTLLLAYKHVKSCRMKQLQNQMFKLGVSAGIDLESVDCNICVEEVVQTTRSNEEKSVTQTVELQTKNLVYSYLRRNGYFDVAEEFAMNCNLNLNTVNLSTDLETIFQFKGMQLISQNDGKKKRKTRTLRGLVAGVDFIDTEQVKFTNTNSQGGAIIMTYKGIQYCFNSYSRNNQVSHWQCRRRNKLKCNGWIHLCNKTTTVIKEIPHNDKDHSERLKVSTMGTDDTTIKYSKTRMKNPVLHFRGYEYLKAGRNPPDGRVRWQCRYVNQKKCPGNLYTKAGFIDGQVREHSHLPTDLPPVEKPKSDRMISNLF